VRDETEKPQVAPVSSSKSTATGSRKPGRTGEPLRVLADAENPHRVRRIINIDPGTLAIDHPDHPNARAEIFGDLCDDIVRRIVWAHNRDCQIWRDIPGSAFGERRLAGQRVGYEGDIRTAQKVGARIDEKQDFAEHLPKAMSPDELEQKARQNRRHFPFKRTYRRFLYRSAIDEFVQAVALDDRVRGGFERRGCHGTFPNSRDPDSYEEAISLSIRNKLHRRRIRWRP
jgi:hypothetical protein